MLHRFRPVAALACCALWFASSGGCANCPDGYELREGDQGRACYEVDPDVGDDDVGDDDVGDDDSAGDNPYGEQDLDLDGDGHPASEDCDEESPSVYPGAEEIPYDGVDQDCDGEDLRDVDGDGFEGAAVGGEDCDDQDAAAYPGAAETPYDGIDQDCDGADVVDLDGDGHASVLAGGDDCDDADPAIHGGAEETPYDGIDQDCSGSDLVDWDGDGHAAEVAGGDDCDDADPGVHPGAAEVCDGNQVDENCDGVILSDPIDCCDTITCSCSNNSPSVGVPCGSGSLHCSYQYNIYGQPYQADCWYDNGATYTCHMSYDIFGTASGTCELTVGFGDTCSFQC